MPFYFRIPLPGPFSYGHRLGGRKRKRQAARKPQGQVIDVGMTPEEAGVLWDALRAEGLSVVWWAALGKHERKRVLGSIREAMQEAKRTGAPIEVNGHVIRR